MSGLALSVGLTSKGKKRGAKLAKVEIYTGMMCPFCDRAIRLLESKNVAYEQHDVTFSPKLRQEMTSRSGGAQTVPQIFIDDMAMGGCDELHGLEHLGKLDALLGLS